MTVNHYKVLHLSRAVRVADGLRINTAGDVADAQGAVRTTNSSLDSETSTLAQHPPLLEGHKL